MNLEQEWEKAALPKFLLVVDEHIADPSLRRHFVLHTEAPRFLMEIERGRDRVNGVPYFLDRPVDALTIPKLMREAGEFFVNLSRR